VSVWSQLLRDIAADPPSAQRTMVDILNEPDSRGLACAHTPDLAPWLPANIPLADHVQ
jgi:hypothetical protein